jgi:hypothetical protein
VFERSSLPTTVVITLSGPGGAYLRSYDATTGHLIFESRLHKAESGKLLEPPSIGQDVAFSVDKTSDVFALTNAHTVRRVDGLVGELKWEWTSEDQRYATAREAPRY